MTTNGRKMKKAKRSKRRTPKRKEAPRTIPDVRDAAPRALVRGTGTGPAYPAAADLIARSPEWKEWLDVALRSVLRPAALAGAVGLAGLGCDGSAAAGLAGEWVSGTPEATATQGQVAFTGIASDKFLSGGPGGADAPLHTGGGVVMSPLPGMPPPGGPAGTITPLPDPPELDGDVAAVHPHPPTVLGEAPVVIVPPPVIPAVRPPAMRGRIAPVRPRPVAPPPDIAVPGGLSRVMPPPVVPEPEEGS